MTIRIPTLVACRIGVTLRAQSEASLPSFLGSTLRGALAMALKKVSCALRIDDCAGCLVAQRCPYAILFETAPDSTIGTWQNRENWPRPIVIEPPESAPECYLKNDCLRFGITLFGRAVDHFPYLIYALNSMARFGLGRDRHPFELMEVIDEALPGNRAVLYKADQSVTHLTTPVAFDPVKTGDRSDRSVTSVRLQFVTPVRLVDGGALTDDLPFPVLVKALAGRISSIAYFHCGVKDSWDYKAFIDGASTIAVRQSNLQFRSLNRWSNRQRRNLSLSGLMGTISFSGESLPTFMDLLRVGSIVHIGKGTVLGLGKYHFTVESASS